MRPISRDAIKIGLEKSVKNSFDGKRVLVENVIHFWWKRVPPAVWVLAPVGFIHLSVV